MPRRRPRSPRIRPADNATVIPELHQHLQTAALTEALYTWLIPLTKKAEGGDLLAAQHLAHIHAMAVRVRAERQRKK